MTSGRVFTNRSAILFCTKSYFSLVGGTAPISLNSLRSCPLLKKYWIIHHKHCQTGQKQKQRTSWKRPVFCFYNYCIPIIFLKFSYAVSSLKISTISGLTIFSNIFKESGSITFDKIKFLSISVNGSPIADL